MSWLSDATGVNWQVSPIPQVNVNSGVGQAAANIGSAAVPQLGHLNDPKLQPTADQEVRGLIDEYKKNAQGPQQITQGLMRGVGDAGAAVGFSPTGQALSARAKRAFQSGAGDLQRQATMMGYQQGVPRLGRAAALDIEMNNIARGVQSQMLAADLQADQTRYQAITSALGGIGSGLGGIAGLMASSNKTGGGGSGVSPMSYIDYNPGQQNLFQQPTVKYT